jgi:integrase
LNDRAKLTEDFVAKLKPRSARFFVWEEGWRGGQFGIRVMPSGVKVYVVRYRVGIGQGAPEKLRKLDDVGNLTLKAARDRAQEVITQARQGVDILDALYLDTDTVTFESYAREYVKTQAVDADLSPYTVWLYNGYLDSKLIPFFKNKPLRDIREAHVKAFKKKYADVPVLANRCLRLLKQILKQAAKDKVIASNPAQDVDPYPEKKSAGVYYKIDEMERLGVAMREVGNKNHRIDFLLLLAFTGCRPAELASLRLHQFDRDAQALLLQRTRRDRKTKTKTMRVVALNSVALSIVERLAAEVTDNRATLFPVGGSVKSYLRSVQDLWVKLREMANLPEGVRAYDLRHNLGSWAAMLNTNQGLVKELLGHQNLETSNIYMHLATDPVREASDRVATKLAGALFGGKAG